jgi:hypothetical protein
MKRHILTLTTSAFILARGGMMGHGGHDGLWNGNLRDRDHPCFLRR